MIVSARLAPDVAGGVCSPRAARKPARARTCRSKAAQASASAPDQVASSAAVRSLLPQKVTARPSGCGAKALTSGPTSESPREPRSSSRYTAGRNRPTVWKRPGAREPSSSVRVSTDPPSVARFSSRSVRMPAFAR